VSIRFFVERIWGPDQLQIGTHHQRRCDISILLLTLIAITETMVGGGSASDLLKTLRKLIKKYRNVTFRVLLLEQTMHREQGAADGMTLLPVVDANRIEVVIQSVKYILGEDVNFQNVPDSRHPVIVFKGSKDQLSAYKIVPITPTSSRDVIVDLVDGAYNGFLPGIL
jgi:hypothetical protein